MRAAAHPIAAFSLRCSLCLCFSALYARSLSFFFLSLVSLPYLRPSAPNFLHLSMLSRPTICFVFRPPPRPPPTPTHRRSLTGRVRSAHTRRRPGARHQTSRARSRDLAGTSHVSGFTRMGGPINASSLELEHPTNNLRESFLSSILFFSRKTRTYPHFKLFFHGWSYLSCNTFAPFESAKYCLSHLILVFLF
jgi:hypothetical protein